MRPTVPAVVLTHAYSASNAGDGWLVDLAIDLVREAVHPAEVTVVAVDGDHIAGADRVLTFGGRSRSPVGAGRTLLASFGLGRTPETSAIRSADLVVAVGGGYLRGRRPRQLAVMWLVHGTQLRAAARRVGPTVYLPQSIGPLPGPVAHVVRRHLGRTTSVHGRDDDTMAFLAGIPQVSRTPDLAALAVADAAPRAVAPWPSTERPIPVLWQVRPLPERPHWEADLLAFVADSDLQLVPALQSSAGRSNDDLALTRALVGGGDLRSVTQVLADAPDLTVAICGRLHAALACIDAGVAAIHIGYERKSLGVFTDLGLERFVVPPTAEGLQQARALVRELTTDTVPYWANLAARSNALRAHRAALVAELGRLASAS